MGKEERQYHTMALWFVKSALEKNTVFTKSPRRVTAALLESAELTDPSLENNDLPLTPSWLDACIILETYFCQKGYYPKRR